MSQLLIHWFHFAEVYAVMLVWIIVPLGFYGAFIWLAKHHGVLVTKLAAKEGSDNAVH